MIDTLYRTAVGSVILAGIICAVILFTKQSIAFWVGMFLFVSYLIGRLVLPEDF